MVSGDHRTEIGMSPGPPPAGASGRGPEAQGSPAPINLVLISDVSRFGAGTQELKCEWGAIDTGLVSQNIALFCAAKGLGTRDPLDSPR